MWKKEYEVGIELIDTQHQRLFEYAGVMAGILGKDQSDEEFRAQIKEALRFLKMYCLDHFKDEESYHAQISVENYKEHKKLHVELVKDVLEYEERVVKSDFDHDEIENFLGFVADWLINHVAGADQDLQKLAEIKAGAPGGSMWKDEYLVGVEKIDRQHRILFDFVELINITLNQPLEAYEYEKKITDAVSFLKTYCLEHFKDEEAYYEQKGYSGLEEHKELHKKLVQKLLDYEMEFGATNFAPQVVKKFLGFVLTWLIYHVAGEDQKIKEADRAEAPVEEGAGSVHDFASRAKRVLRTITGLSEKDVDFDIGYTKGVDEGYAFMVGLVDGGDKQGIGLIYSEAIALGALKAMTSMEATEINEITLSALQEISNIVSSRIADSVTESLGGKFCDIEYPVRADINDIPDGSERFLMNTTIGDMEIIVY